MVLDAGGGTVDATTHLCEARKGTGPVVLSEQLAAVGGMCGSSKVDEAFLWVNLLCVWWLCREQCLEAFHCPFFLK